MNLDMTKLKHMDITEMPSDPNGYLGKIRGSIRGAYNANRDNETVMLLLKETLEYALGMIEAAAVSPTPVSPKAPAGSASSTSSPKKKTKPAERAAQR